MVETHLANNVSPTAPVSTSTTPPRVLDAECADAIEALITTGPAKSAAALDDGGVLTHARRADHRRLQEQL